MNNNKTVIILGASGFIGRPIVIEALTKVYRVIVTTRGSRDSFIQAFEGVFSEKIVDQLKKAIKEQRLLLITDFDYYTDRSFETLFDSIKMEIDINSLCGVINVIGDTSGNIKSIMESTLKISYFLRSFIKILDCELEKKPVVIHTSSIAAKYPFGLLPPYERAKLKSERILKASNSIDYNLYFTYAKGIGETKMRKAAENVVPFLSKNCLLSSIKVSIVDVERLAKDMLQLIEITYPTETKAKRSYIDTYITNGNIDILKLFLLLRDGVIDSSLIPKCQHGFRKAIERISLLLRGIFVDLTCYNNQYERRLSHFYKLAAINGLGAIERRYNTLGLYKYMKTGISIDELNRENICKFKLDGEVTIAEILPDEELFKVIRR